MTEAEPSGEGIFPATMWSMVAGAGHADEAASMAALERLARAYWRPLFVFARQRGNGHDEAAEAVQGFFAHLLSKDILCTVERRETRFRTFLLHCFTNWMVSQYRRYQAAKRGGGAVLIPLSDFDSENGVVLVSEMETPEMAYDRRWARTIYERAQQRLTQEVNARPRADYWQAVQQRVLHPGTTGPLWSEVADQFGVSEGSVRKAALELRGRLAALLRLEVCGVVSDVSEVDEELRYFFRLLSEAG